MKKLTLPYKILIGIVIVLIIAVSIGPNRAKKWYKKIIGEYEVVDKDLQKKIEDLNKQREKDSIRYAEAIRMKELEYEFEISQANEKYDRLTKRFRQNEKELDDYRNSNFDDKFELFSNAVIRKDTVQR